MGKGPGWAHLVLLLASVAVDAVGTVHPTCYIRLLPNDFATPVPFSSGIPQLQVVVAGLLKGHDAMTQRTT